MLQSKPKFGRTKRISNYRKVFAFCIREWGIKYKRETVVSTGLDYIICVYWSLWEFIMQMFGQHSSCDGINRIRWLRPIAFYAHYAVGILYGSGNYYKPKRTVNISINSLYAWITFSSTEIPTHTHTHDTGWILCDCCDAAISDNRKYHIIGTMVVCVAMVVARFNLWMHNCYLNSFKFWYIDASGFAKLLLFEWDSIDLNLKAWKIQHFNIQIHFIIHRVQYINININIVENHFRCSVSGRVVWNCLARKWILSTLLTMFIVIFVATILNFKKIYAMTQSH